MINDPTMNFDVYGHCVCCHENMLIEQVVDGKVIKRFTAQYDEAQFLLNDGSKMRVAICRDCKAENKHHNYDEVMACVFNGWKHEVDQLIADPDKPEWTEEKGQAHLSKYSQLTIVTHTDDKDTDSLTQHMKAHKENNQ